MLSRRPTTPQWRRRRLVRWSHLSRGWFRDDDGVRQTGCVGALRLRLQARPHRRFELAGPSFTGAAKVCERPFWLEERGTSGDIADTFGVCDCGEERSLYEALGPNTNALGVCDGKKALDRTVCAGGLWWGALQTACTHGEQRILPSGNERNFAPRHSMRELADKVASNYERLKTAADLGMLTSFRMIGALDAAFDGIDDDAVITEFHRQSLEAARVRMYRSRQPSLRILNKGDVHIGQDDPRSRFHAETVMGDTRTPNGDVLFDGIDKLVLVHRLREVVSLLGFTRLEAINPDKDGELDLEVIRASLAETITWLPAIENRGEGVFVSFKEEEIERWVARPGVRARGQDIEAGWHVWGHGPEGSERAFPRAALCDVALTFPHANDVYRARLRLSCQFTT